MIFSAIIVAFFLVCLFVVAVGRWSTIVVLYLAFVYLDGLFPYESSLFGFFSLNNAIVCAALLKYVVEKSIRSGVSGTIVSRFCRDQLQVVLLLIFGLFFFFPFYINLKQLMIGDPLGPANVPELLRVILQHGLEASALVVVAVKIVEHRLLSPVRLGIILYVVIISTSLVFYQPLEALGFNINYGPEGRVAGFQYTNVNSLAASMAVLCAYVLANFEVRKQPIYLVVILYTIIGVLFTGSKTGFITILGILGLFVVSRGSRLGTRARLLSLSSLIVIGFLFFNLESPIQDRILKADFAALMATEESADTRMSKNLVYIGDMARNPHYFLIGNTHERVIEKSVHNYFLYLVWNGGALWLGIYLYGLFKFYGLNRALLKRSAAEFRLVYVVIALMAVAMTGYGPSYHVPIILFCSIGLADVRISGQRQPIGVEP